MSVKLKVCGITSIEDALVAIECGAEYLGFNFYPESPRFIEPDAARRIIEQLPRQVISVGVFVNEPQPVQVIKILRLSGAQVAQLHGDEDKQYCSEVGEERVIKALRIGPDFKLGSVKEYPAFAILLDAYDKNLYGGTGKTANWEIACSAARLVKVFLAGGLSPENIGAAIAVVKPFAVDVNSGVESAPGKKSAEKLTGLKQEMGKLK